MNATTYTFERAIFNGVRGWIATRRIGGTYAGKTFARTRKEAQAKFD